VASSTAARDHIEIRLSIPHLKVIASPDPQVIEMIRLFRGLNGYGRA
jgi:hypothetical protein